MEAKIALVTGAIKGLGLEIAKNLLKQGVRCLVTYFDWLDDLDHMHSQLEATGTAYKAVQVDLRAEEGA
ncbi:MAG: SDR family oxidoreductase, partial [Thermodesulfobacteria bacterium]|nr:SDR family oxidoreductase [Thermodesulfobacteriota bacterium]